METALEELRRTQDRIISQQKLAELGELAAGVAHEIRNPLQFVRNFATSSGMLIDDLEALLEQTDGFDREEARDIMRDILGNMERMTHHSDRANGIVSGMMTLDRGTGGDSGPWTSTGWWTSRPTWPMGPCRPRNPGSALTQR